jgi:hypothetical protein
MKDKTRSTFTFQIAADVRAALDQMAAEKEWTTGHLVGSILAAHVASVGKPAKTAKRKAAKKPAAVAASVAPADDTCPACHGEQGRIRTCGVCKGLGRLLPTVAESASDEPTPADDPVPF